MCICSFEFRGGKSNFGTWGKGSEERFGSGTYYNSQQVCKCGSKSRRQSCLTCLATKFSNFQPWGQSAHLVSSKVYFMVGRITDFSNFLKFIFGLHVTRTTPTWYPQHTPHLVHTPRHVPNTSTSKIIQKTPYKNRQGRHKPIAQHRPHTTGSTTTTFQHPLFLIAYFVSVPQVVQTEY